MTFHLAGLALKTVPGVLSLSSAVVIQSGELLVLTVENGTDRQALMAFLSGINCHPASATCFTLSGAELTDLPASERARRGMFMLFADPSQLVPGIKVYDFLRDLYFLHHDNYDPLELAPFLNALKPAVALLSLDKNLLQKRFDAALGRAALNALDCLAALLVSPQLLVIEDMASCDPLFVRHCLAMGTAILGFSARPASAFAHDPTAVAGVTVVTQREAL